MTSAAPGEPRAWGWVRHLRDGGTTPWAEWSGTAEPAGPAVPGAQQLELLRRLNQAGAPGPALVDRVLTASAPGRGQPDLELVGAAHESSFGPRPVDPSDVPVRELLRVATALIAEDLVAAGVPPEPRPGLVRPWRTRYRLVGDPELADPVRAALVARGRPPGGRAPRILVVGSSVDRMLADAWTRRAFDFGAPGWRTWLDQVARHDRLPGRVDVLAQARSWSARVGRARVQVVLDPEALPGLLGVRRVPSVAPLAAQVPDLARRVAPVLGLHVPGDERTALLGRRLRPQLVGTPGEPLVLPDELHPWARAQAQRVADGLRRAGYAVHGDPHALLPADRSGVRVPDGAATLRLAMAQVLAGATGPGPRGTKEEAA